MRKHVITYHDQLRLKDIVHYMEEGGVSYLAVVDETGKLKGSIAETDIRRAILTNKDQIKDIINPHPPKASIGTDSQKINAVLRRQYTPYLPIVDQAMRLLDLQKVDELDIHQKKNKVVLMVGGLGRRLGELTREIPKPMLPLGHKPILQLIVESFVDHGFRDFYFCVNYRAEAIKEYFGDGEEFGVNIEYIEESKPLGTAGPLSLIEEDWEEPFIVMNGDLITTLNFESLLGFHQEKGGLATMCIHEYNYQLPFGVVHTRNAKILSLNEKPLQKCFINAGIYVLEKEALKYVDQGQYIDMTTVFERMLQADEAVHSYFINEFWLDIGQAKDYEATREVFSHYKI